MTTFGGPRRRGVAVLFSIGVAGLGELYAGRPGAAVVTILTVSLLAALAIVVAFAPLHGPLVLILPVVIVLGAWAFRLVRADRAARGAPNPYPLQPYNRWYWYVLAALIAFFVWRPAWTGALRARWIEAFRIPSPSMEPTMQVGDFIFVSKRPAARIPHQDGLIVVAPVDERIVVVKRVVGMPGDTLAMEDGRLIRNGQGLVEPYAQTSAAAGAALEKLEAGRHWHLAHLVDGAFKTEQAYDPDMRNWGPLVIPAESVFVLGDSRDHSYDSRFYGAVAMNRIRGKPLVIYFSLADGSVCWSRIGLRF